MNRLKKICSVVGARPQFIKLAVVSREIRKRFKEIIVHTGQHFDYNMSEVFFEEMQIPHPDYNLGISGGTHGKMTGNMIIALEEVFINEKPDAVLVFGDTNSTMAAALAAVKLCIPIIHVEAGGRLGTLTNPEEVNRIVTDHVSSLHLVCTQSGVGFLQKEGFDKSIHLVGDPMYDAFIFYSSIASDKEKCSLDDFDGVMIDVPDVFYYMTCHRQENTDTDEKLKQILDAMNSLDAPAIYPVHPRNRERARRLVSKYGMHNIMLAQPVSYLASVWLTKNAKKIVTDSGGLQREAFFARKACVTVFDYVAWPETMINNCNQLAKPDRNDILEKLSVTVSFDEDYHPFGDGCSAKKIAQCIFDYLGD